MRILAGGALLCLLFAGAFLWQRHWTARARAERDAAYAREALPEPADEVPEGWSRVIVGRPSGAARFAPPLETAPGPEPAPAPEPGPAAPTEDAGREPATGTAPDAGGAPAAAREFQLVVQRGMSLSSICKQHYGSARREIVTALARHNALADENALREGQRLVLPPLEKLLGR